MPPRQANTASTVIVMDFPDNRRSKLDSPYPSSVSPQFILELEVALFSHMLGLFDEIPPGGLERLGQRSLRNLSENSERL
jgi:hypothetical protein